MKEDGVFLLYKHSLLGSKFIIDSGFKQNPDTNLIVGATDYETLITARIALTLFLFICVSVHFELRSSIKSFSLPYVSNRLMCP
jgi:hypothetical protein